MVAPTPKTSEARRASVRRYQAKKPRAYIEACRRYRQKPHIKAKSLARLARWAAAHPEKRAEINARHEAKRRIVPELKRMKSDNKRMFDYGLDPATYDAMVQKSEGRCGICSGTGFKSGGHSGLVIDHNHTTGAVRGLLCGACNLAISYLERPGRDAMEWFARAVKYMEGGA